jgi:L-ribulose-5-phosphate 3-epimerase
MPAIPEPKNKESTAPAYSPGGLILGSAPRAADPAVLLRESLSDLGAHGVRTGSVLALDIGIDPAEKVAEYVATFGHGGLGVNYDPANMLINGHDAIRGLAPLHDKLVHVHARDARRSSAGRGAVEVALGAGDIDWMTFVAVLGTVGYRGWLVVERSEGTNRVADCADALDVLRRFVRPA